MSFAATSHQVEFLKALRETTQVEDFQTERSLKLVSGTTLTFLGKYIYIENSRASAHMCDSFFDALSSKLAASIHPRVS